jgi:WD40 repeat protein/Tfp pilus assembly protein PilF/predicted Ser/Thr protein kinase
MARPAEPSPEEKGAGGPAPAGTPPTVPAAGDDDQATGAWSGAGRATEGGAGAANPQPVGRLGRYRLLKELGRGGMGVVYLAHDEKLDREVALKVPAIGPDNSSAIRKRFLREARAAANLSHPNICPVYDVGEIDGTCYLVMAYVEGKTLASLMKGRKPSSEASAAGIVRQVALAMHYAHERGVVHRDLKPANVMFERGKRLIVMDFGLAFRSGHGAPAAGEGSEQAGSATAPADSRLTHDGDLLGTPAYMPPEQASGDLEAMGPASDVYSLGVILYELLTGQVPFRGDRHKVVAQLLLVPPPAPSSLRPGLSPGLEAVCLKALAKEPAGRFAAMKDFADALTPFLSARPAAPPAPATAPPADAAPSAEVEAFGALAPAAPVRSRTAAAPRRRRRLSVVLTVAAVVLLAHLAAGGGWWYYATDRGDLVLDLDGAPPQLAIEVDGAPAVPDDGVLRGLRAGPHMLVVTAKGFEPHRESFVVSRGGRAELQVRLRPQAAAAPPSKPPAVKDAVARLLGEAREARKQGQPAAVIAGCDEALKLNPDSAEAYDLRSAAFCELGNYDRALEDCKSWLERVPGDGSAFERRSRAYLGREMFEEARDAADRALAIHKNSADAYADRGWARANLGDDEGALSDYDAALKINPNNALWYLCRSRVHERGDAPDLARRDRDEAVKRDKGMAERPLALRPYPPAVARRRALARARKLVRQGESEAAISLCTDLLKQDGRDPEALVVRGQARVETGDIDKALEDCGAALAIDAKSAPALAVRAAALLRRDDEEAAVISATLALRLDPRLTPAWTTRAWAYARLGEHELALKDYDRALSLDDTDPATYLARSVVHLRARHPEAAEADRKKAQEIAPDFSRRAPRLKDPPPRPEVKRLVPTFDSRELRTKGQVNCVAASRDGKRMAAAGAAATGAPADVVMFAGEKVARRTHGESVWALAFSPEGKRLLYAGGGTLTKNGWVKGTDYHLYLWDPVAAPVDQLRQFKGEHEDRVSAVAFFDDGDRALSASYDRRLILWNVKKGEKVREFTGHTGEVYCAALSPDNKLALSGSEDATVRLWNVATGEELRRFEGHSGAVTGVAFSPDGKRALSGSLDKTARIWDVATGTQLRSLPAHETGIKAVAWSSDGKRALTTSGVTAEAPGALVSTAKDRCVHLWDVRTGAEVGRCDNRERAAGPPAILDATFLPPGDEFILACGAGGFLARLELAK